MGNGVQVGRVGRPELESRHLHRGAAVRESGLHLARAVKDERRVKVARVEVNRLDLHRARLVVARAHEELAVVEDEGHAVVEAAPEVKVVERLRELLVAPVEAVVHGGDKRVRARRERPRRELHAAVREVVDADLASVHPELPVEPHAVDDEPGIAHALLKRERAPIHRGAAFHERIRHRVEAPRHDHPSGRLECRPGDRRDGAPFVEAELPRSVEIQRRSAQCARKGERSNQCLFHFVNLIVCTERAGTRETVNVSPRPSGRHVIGPLSPLPLTGHTISSAANGLSSTSRTSSASS